MVSVSSRQSSMTCSLSPSDNVEYCDHCEGGSSPPSSSLCLIDFDMIAVINRAQKPNFSYRWMCPGLWDQVISPSCLVPQLAKHSSIGSIKRDPMPLFQRSGSTVNGPKKPTLPQLVASWNRRVYRLLLPRKPHPGQLTSASARNQHRP